MRGAPPPAAARGPCRRRRRRLRGRPCQCPPYRCAPRHPWLLACHLCPRRCPQLPRAPQPQPPRAYFSPPRASPASPAAALHSAVPQRSHRRATPASCRAAPTYLRATQASCRAIQAAPPPPLPSPSPSGWRRRPLGGATASDCTRVRRPGPKGRILPSSHPRTPGCAAHAPSRASHSLGSASTRYRSRQHPRPDAAHRHRLRQRLRTCRGPRRSH